MEAGRPSARSHPVSLSHPVSAVARALGDHIATGTAVIAATGARLSRHLTGRPAGPLPEHVRLAIDDALAAESGRAAAGARRAAARSAGQRPQRGSRAVPDAVALIPRPRTATA